MRRRQDLKPWARRVPRFVLRLLLVVASPLFVVVSAWEGGIKDGFGEWLREWRETGDLEPVARRDTRGKR